jgi:hypothetical protein
MRTSGRPWETTATQRLRSSSAGSPGSSEAVWPSGPRPSSVTSKSGRCGMNILWRHRRFGEHRFAGHPKIAFGMIVRDETLVSPIPRHPLPRETIPEFVRRQKSIKRLWRRSARERDSERTLPGCRRFCHPLRHLVRQRQRIRQDLDVPDGLAHSAPANLVEPSMKASIALAKPSSL